MKDKIENLKYELRFINFDAKVCLVGLGLCVILICIYLVGMLVNMFVTSII